MPYNVGPITLEEHMKTPKRSIVRMLRDPVMNRVAEAMYTRYTEGKHSHTPGQTYIAYADLPLIDRIGWSIAAREVVQLIREDLDVQLWTPKHPEDFAK